ncbi:MAG: hypothetical protein V9E94_20750 [Microthrixaceae bacterium]
MVLRLATRRSPLALWQAEHVGALLKAAHPGLAVELVAVSTEGDRRLDVALSEIGGKGVFATEVQAALLDGRGGRGGALGQGPAGGHRRRAAARSGAGAW